MLTLSNPDGCDKDGVELILVENKETHTAIKWHKWKQPGTVVVDDATVLVCECPKAGDVCNCFISIICNYLRAQTCPICGARICWVRNDWWLQ